MKNGPMSFVNESCNPFLRMRDLAYLFPHEKSLLCYVKLTVGDFFS